MAWADENIVKLITGIGAAPACPISSTCEMPFEDTSCGFNSGFGGFGFNGYNGFGAGRRAIGRPNGCGNGFGGFGRWLGSVTEIPMHAIATFTHNAI